MEDHSLFFATGNPSSGHRETSQPVTPHRFKLSSVYLVWTYVETPNDSEEERGVPLLVTGGDARGEFYRSAWRHHVITTTL